jgi:phosphoglycolate phosphatase-like HAD superfamily hydrolase
VNDITYIGDEDRDIIAAKRLGVGVIAVSWGYNYKELLIKEKPDYLIDLPVKILEILNRD